MPNYYNTYPVNGWQYGAYPNYYTGAQIQQPQQSQQYMINVDGEMAARAWQMPGNLSPNTIIPLWDLDGQHVYFKSVDAYGRMNPLRKGRIVFDDEPVLISQGSQQSSAPSQYVTREDLDSLKQELKSMLSQNNNQQNYQKNQNGSRNNNRGET